MAKKHLKHIILYILFINLCLIFNISNAEKYANKTGMHLPQPDGSFKIDFWNANGICYPIYTTYSNDQDQTLSHLELINHEDHEDIEFFMANTMKAFEIIINEQKNGIFTLNNQVKLISKNKNYFPSFTFPRSAILYENGNKDWIICFDNNLIDVDIDYSKILFRDIYKNRLAYHSEKALINSGKCKE